MTPPWVVVEPNAPQILDGAVVVDGVDVADDPPLPPPLFKLAARLANPLSAAVLALGALRDLPLLPLLPLVLAPVLALVLLVLPVPLPLPLLP